MSKTTLNRHIAARHLAVAAVSSKDPKLRADSAALLSEIDAGCGGVQQKVETFLAASWSRIAREVAAGTARPASLKEVGELETALGLAPSDDASDEQETDTVADTADEPETDTETVTVSDTETITETVAPTYAYGGAA